MEEIKVQKTYAEFKNALDTEFNTAAESFNRIGYLLKVARDTDILAESGYKTVAEFAEAEYGLRKDDVSRFIAINDRYSEGGYSEQLADRYKGYGRAKLQEMLSLPQSIVDAIPLTTTKASIQEIKKEYKEEQAITDIEVMLEDKNESQEAMESTLEKVLHQLMQDNKDLFKKVFTDSGKEGIYEALAPNGVATHIARLAAVGKLMLTLTDINDKIILLNMRSGEKEEYSMDDAVAAVGHILKNAGDSAKKAYQNLYGEPLEEIKEMPACVDEKPEEKSTEEKEKPVEHEEEVKVAPVQQEEVVHAEVVDTAERPHVDLPLVTQKFYQYFMERIDYPATTLQRELHDIASTPNLNIKINETYTLTANGTDFEIKSEDATVATISSDEMVKALEELNTAESRDISRINNTIEDIKKALKAEDWNSGINYAEMLISLLLNIIKEESENE